MFDARICTVGGEAFTPEWSYERCCRYHSSMRTQQNLHNYSDREIVEYRIRGVLHTCARCGAEIPYYVWLCLACYIEYTGHQPVWSPYLEEMEPRPRQVPHHEVQPLLDGPSPTITLVPESSPRMERTPQLPTLLLRRSLPPACTRAPQPAPRRKLPPALRQHHHLLTQGGLDNDDQN
jgi:hypothetical protein